MSCTKSPKVLVLEFGALSLRASHPCFYGIVCQISKDLIHSPVCQSRMRSNCLIRHIIALTLVMHRRWRVRLAQSRLLAIWADGYRVIGEVLKYLGLLQAIVAMIDVGGQVRPPARELPVERLCGKRVFSRCLFPSRYPRPSSG